MADLALQRARDRRWTVKWKVHGNGLN